MNHNFGGGGFGYVSRHRSFVDDDLDVFVAYVERSLETGAPLAGETARRESNVSEPMLFAGGTRSQNRGPAKSRYTAADRPVDLAPVVVVSAGRNARLLYTRSGSTSPELPRIAAAALAAVLNPTVYRPLRREPR